MEIFTVQISFDVLGETPEAAVARVREELDAQSLSWSLDAVYDNKGFQVGDETTG